MTVIPSAVTGRARVLAILLPAMSIETIVDEPPPSATTAKQLGAQAIATSSAKIGVLTDPVTVGELVVRSRKVTLAALKLVTTAVVPSGVTAVSMTSEPRLRVDWIDRPGISKMWIDDEFRLATIALPALTTTIVPTFVIPPRSGETAAEAPLNKTPPTVAVALTTRLPWIVGTLGMENVPSACDVD